MTLVSLFNKTFQTHADKVAIEFNDKTVTFGEINKSANKVANALRDLSVKKGDRVALFLSNSLELIYFFIGILKNGSVVVPMNTFFKERETSHILNNSGAKVILTDKERLPTIKKILPGLEGSKHIITVDSNDNLYVVGNENNADWRVQKISSDGVSIWNRTFNPAGTDIAIETSDFVLMSDELAKIPYVIKLSRRTTGIMRQNIVVSLLIITFLVPVAVFGWIDLVPGLLINEVGGLIVITNGLRLLR